MRIITEWHSYWEDIRQNVTFLLIMTAGGGPAWSRPHPTARSGVRKHFFPDAWARTEDWGIVPFPEPPRNPLGQILWHLGHAKAIVMTFLAFLLAWAEVVAFHLLQEASGTFKLFMVPGTRWIKFLWIFWYKHVCLPLEGINPVSQEILSVLAGGVGAQALRAGSVRRGPGRPVPVAAGSGQFQAAPQRPCPAAGTAGPGREVWKCIWERAKRCQAVRTEEKSVSNSPASSKVREWGIFLITLINWLFINVLPITYMYQTEKAYRFRTKAWPRTQSQPCSFAFNTTAACEAAQNKAVVLIPGTTDHQDVFPLYTKILPTCW